MTAQCLAVVDKRPTSLDKSLVHEIKNIPLVAVASVVASGNVVVDIVSVD